ncbi:MAG: hypothetical protein ACFCUL_08605 [Flavobacteriaceae bacterium]
MSKFLIRVTVFFSILLLLKLLQVALVVKNLNPIDSSNFYGVDSNKSRIILVGSSNLDFNYDYQKLNASFDGYDVVGCNLNEPSGLYATVYKLKKLNPKKDDILVFCLPHSLYEPDKLIPLGSSGKKGFSANMIKNALVDFPFGFIGSVLNIKTSDSYKLLLEKESYGLDDGAVKFYPNTESDVLPDFLECKKLDGQFDISSTGFDEEYLLAIHRFLNSSFQSRIWFRFPAVKEAEFYVDQARINFLSSNFVFLNDFDDAIYQDEYWYNQWYHLNSCGRELNTTKLMDELKDQINQ